MTNKEGFYQIISNTPWGGSTIWGYISDSSERVEYQDISDEAFVKPYAENPIKMGIYSSKVLEGGKKYYFHVGALQDVSQQKITINLYEVDAQKYSFEERDGKYVSNNKNKNETIASSYIPIDLSNRTGKYDLNISATISAETWDRGYVILTKSQKLPEDPEDSRSDGMIIEMYGGANERTFQILTQVAGRAGRGQDKGNVIIQTYNPDNLSIEYSKEQNYRLFYNTEIIIRKQLKYPPFCDIILIGFSSENEKNVIESARFMYMSLKNKIINEKLQIILYKPVPAPIDKIKNKIRWRIIIKCKFNNEIIEALNTSLKDLNSKKLKDVKTIIDLNPTNMM